jgi:hypothetical protein
MAYGETKKKGDIPFDGLQVFGGLADQISVDFITKKSTPIEVNRGIVETHISFMEFKKRLHAAHGRIDPDLAEALRTKYETGIDVKKSEEVIRAIVDGTWNTEDNSWLVAHSS